MINNCPYYLTRCTDCTKHESQLIPYGFCDVYVIYKKQEKEGSRKTRESYLNIVYQVN